MLEERIIEFPLAKGLNEKLHPFVLDPDRFAEVVNGYFSKSGSIYKRPGFQGTSNSEYLGGSDRESCHKLFTYEDELCCIDEARGTLRAIVDESWTPTLGDREKDYVPEATIDRWQVHHTAFESVANSDVAIATDTAGNVWEVYAYQTQVSTGPTNYVKVAVRNRNTGEVLFDDAVSAIDGSALPKCVTLSSEFVFVFYARSNTLYYQRLDTDDMSFTAEASLVTLSATTNSYDVCVVGSNVYVAYRNAAGTMTVTSYDVGGAQQSTATIAEAVSTGIGIGGIGSDIYVAWAYSNAGNLEIHASRHAASALSTNTGAVVLSTVPTVWSHTTIRRIGIVAYPTSSALGAMAHIVWEQYDGTTLITTGDTGGAIVCWSSMTPAGAVGYGGTTTGGYKTFRVQLDSRPFRYHDRSYCVLAFWPHNQASGSLLQYQLYLVELTHYATDEVPRGARPIAMMAQREGLSRHFQCNGRSTSVGGIANLPHIPNVDLTTFVWPGHIVEVIDPDALGSARTAIDGFQFNMSERGAYEVTHLGLATTMSMGLVSTYDGHEVHENNFCWYPWIMTITGVASGGSMADGVYDFVVIYEARDYRGQVYYSQVSESAQVTISGGSGSGSVELEIPYLHLTTRQDYENRVATTGNYTPSVVIRVFRSEVGGGAPYYDIAPESPAINIWVPDPAAQFATITATANDTTVSANARVYTDGGIQANVQPPPARYCVTHKNRVWLAGCENKHDLYYSKEFLRGEGVAFTEFNTVRIEDGGGVTGLATMDDSLVVFKRNRIYRFLGSGTNDQGGDNDLSEPIPVSSDVGCINGHYIVSTSEGLLFPSQRGIYLLDRAYSTQYISHAVESSYDSYGPITSAVLQEAKNLVIWSLDGTNNRVLSAGGGKGVDHAVWLVYDLYHQQWTTWESQLTGPETAVVHRDKYWWGDLNGNVYSESDGTNGYPFTDTPSALSFYYVYRTTVTPWYQPAGHQGEARVWKVAVLGQNMGDHTLAIEVAKDYSDTWTSIAGWSEEDAGGLTGLNNLTRSPVQALEAHIPRTHQVCQAIRFRILEAEPLVTAFPTNTPYEGFRMTGIRLTYGVRRTGIGRLEEGARR